MGYTVLQYVEISLIRAVWDQGIATIVVVNKLIVVVHLTLICLPFCIVIIESHSDVDLLIFDLTPFTIYSYCTYANITCIMTLFYICQLDNASCVSDENTGLGDKGVSKTRHTAALAHARPTMSYISLV